VSSTGIPGLVLAHPIPSRLITVYHQQEQQRTTKEYPLGVQTPNSQYISGCIYMDGCFSFWLGRSMFDSAYREAHLSFVF
jgi:hypothetical protein